MDDGHDPGDICLLQFVEPTPGIGNRLSIARTRVVFADNTTLLQQSRDHAPRIQCHGETNPAPGQLHIISDVVRYTATGGMKARKKKGWRDGLPAGRIA